MNTIVYQSSEFEQPTDGDQAYQDLMTGNGSNRGPFSSREQAEITLLKEEVGCLRDSQRQLQRDFRLLLELVAPEVLEKNHLGIETGLAGAIKRKTGAF